jgi:hypothetical protein
MSKIKYVDHIFRPSALDIIAKADAICNDYARQGYELTLRQLYYQFVSRSFIANKDSEYKRLGGIINDARLAGLLDWDHLEDRTRNLASLSHWMSPSAIVNTCARAYRVDKWSDQATRPEVWVEKEALAGVVQRVAERLDVPYFSCRGYVSQSEMHSAAQRIRQRSRKGQCTVIIHLGDHDPSGIDMSRDIQDRLQMFWADTEFRRIALNMDQIEEFNPPPNPAKVTDSRFTAYEEQYGDESWELDALDPATLDGLIEAAVLEFRDERKWNARVKTEEEGRHHLTLCSKNWMEVSEFVTETFGELGEDEDTNEDSEEEE